MRVLVTGGSGVLGRELVRRLAGRAEVRVLSRRPPARPGSDHHAPGDLPSHVQGDLETGDGLAAAVDGVDVIAHCASSADYRRPQRDVAATRRLLAAVAGGVPARPHVVYISIVGVDRIPFGYYRAKLDTERLVEDSGLPWTTLRTTQFHDLSLLFAMLMSKGPVAIVPRGMSGQSVDTGEVAERMAELTLGEPAGRVPDLGGPQVLTGEEGMRTYLAAIGSRKPVLRVPLPGKAAAGFRAGGHLLAGGGVRGTRTFQDYLRSRIRPDGKVEHPYPHWRRR